jgi:predicted Zn-dependent protease
MHASRALIRQAARKRLGRNDFGRHFGSNRNDALKATLRTNFLSTSRHSQRQSTSAGGIPVYIWVSAGGSVFLVAGVYYAFLDRVPLTNRQRWIATDPKLEQELGDVEFEGLLKQFRGSILPHHHRATKTVQRVGSRIATAAQEFMQQQVTLNSNSINLTLLARPYTFTVVQSDMANAFCLPGNHVFVMTGLFRYARTEDELAAIMGHESKFDHEGSLSDTALCTAISPRHVCSVCVNTNSIVVIPHIAVAHNLARHAGEKMSGGMVVNILARLTLLVDPSGMLAIMLLPAATVFRELPHSRIQELEADQIGVHLAAMACFDPRASKHVFQAMKSSLEDNNKTTPEFLSTHPSHDSRLANFDAWMPDVLQIYENNERCHFIRTQMEHARLAAAPDALVRELQALHGTGWFEL